MSNYKTVFFTLGVLQIILGIFMLIPISSQFVYGEFDSSFVLALIITIIFGTGSIEKQEQDLGRNSGDDNDGIYNITITITIISKRILLIPT